MLIARAAVCQNERLFRMGPWIPLLQSESS